jgi:TRAP-type mannitol/chloroaromatic compound transport system permease small subunit
VNTLLALSRAIDALTERIGRLVIWLVLVATLVSAGNALARYALGQARTPGWRSSGICSARYFCWRRATR